MNAPTPLFILGLQRSGTTWLANLLGGHPQVVAIEADEHRGVHESLFFSHFARAYGDLSQEANFQRFATDFTTCDYYRLSNLEPEWIQHIRPRTYAEIFRRMMEETAHRRGGARYWLEKSPHHTLLAEELATLYPDARFISVVRSPQALIRSRLWSSGRTPPPYPWRLTNIARACGAVVLYESWLRHFDAQNPKNLLVSYDAMAKNPTAVGQNITRFLGLEWQPTMLLERYPPNASFRSSTDRHRALSSIDRGWITLGLAVSRRVPWRWLRVIDLRRQQKRGIDWPSWCWRSGFEVPPTSAR